MKPEIIGIDVDEVVAKLHATWIADYNRAYEDTMTLDDITHWDIHKLVKPECGERIFELLRPEMYDEVEAYPGTQRSVRAMRGFGYAVWFITSCGTRELFEAKLRWLDRMGFDYDGVFPVGKWATYKTKAEIPSVDWLIDDHIGNLAGFQGYPVLQTRQHNRLLDWTGKRIRHLDDLVPALQSLSGVPVLHSKSVPRSTVVLMNIEDEVGPVLYPMTQPQPLVEQVERQVAEDGAGKVEPQVQAVTGNSKPTNPKDGLGSSKVPLHFVSGIVKAYAAVAHYLGNVKYGAWNYRASGARASVYKSALDRHMDRWWEGEELDPVDGTPHLANALACINILIEAQYGGNLTDDRPPSRDLNPLYAQVEDIMVRIRERYQDKNPRHYTISDTAA